MSTESLVKLPDVMMAINASPNPNGITMRELLSAMQHSRANASQSRLTFETHEAVHLGIKFGFLQENTGLFKVKHLPDEAGGRRCDARRRTERPDRGRTPSTTSEHSECKKPKRDDDEEMDVDDAPGISSRDSASFFSALTLPAHFGSPSPLSTIGCNTGHRLADVAAVMTAPPRLGFPGPPSSSVRPEEPMFE